MQQMQLKKSKHDCENDKLLSAFSECKDIEISQKFDPEIAKEKFNKNKLRTMNLKKIF